MLFWREITAVLVVSLFCFSRGQVGSRLPFPRMRGRMLLPEPGLQLCRPSPCALLCEYGRDTDGRGCPVCSCRTAPEDTNSSELPPTAKGDENSGEIPPTEEPAEPEENEPLALSEVPSDFSEYCRQEQNRNLSSCRLQSKRPDDFSHYIARYGIDAFGVDPGDYADLNVSLSNDTSLSINPQSGLQALNPCARDARFVHIRTAKNRNNKEVELWVGSDGKGRTKLQVLHQVKCRSATPVHSGCGGTAAAGGFCAEEKTLQRVYVIAQDSLQPRPDWIYVRTSCSCHVEGLG